MLLDALQKVFRKPTYVVLALCVSASVFVLAVWLPNIRLVAGIVSSPDVPFVSKIQLPLSLLGSIETNFTLLSATYTIVIAILFGIYIAMITYFLKRRIKEVGQGGVATGFLGIASGVLGVGCAACGSFLLTSLTLVGAGGVLSFLPLGGSEFGIIGVVLLAVAVYMTAKKIVDPQVCKV
jgi:hypothetical protein